MASRRLREVHTVTYEEARAVCSVHHPGLLKDFCIDDIFDFMAENKLMYLQLLCSCQSDYLLSVFFVPILG